MNELQSNMDRTAATYIRLVLGVGLHDPDYVDAYYGPEVFRTEATQRHLSLDDLAGAAVEALVPLGVPANRVGQESLPDMRRRYLHRQLRSLAARVAMLKGDKLSFDDESLALYDAVAPTHTEEHFQHILSQLNDVLPGSGSIPDRFEVFRKDFTIPADRLDVVFRSAVTESRARTKKHIALPENESFTIEYVTGKTWSGYNWYKGECHSLIQVNTDFPITIDRAVDLASHEGYPGHHVYNSLLETKLVRERGWWEFSVYALFSPQSLIAEGTANFGIAMAFPSVERVDFEREVLFPRAGLDAARAAQYYAAHELFLKLGYAGNEAARRYLNGSITREQAAEWLINYALMSPDRARQRTHFFDQYRSYVINYNLGQDMVKHYVESRGGTADRPEERWSIFEHLLASPRLPSDLIA
jgi:hypothetical protein